MRSKPYVFDLRLLVLRNSRNRNPGIPFQDPDVSWFEEEPPWQPGYRAQNLLRIPVSD
jgi:hypothetical protein